MFDAPMFVDRAFLKLRERLVPQHYSPETFDASATRLRPRAVRALDAIFQERPWGGWLQKRELTQFVGRLVRRRAPWPRDPRMIPISLNEQARVLAFHYDVETIARSDETRTLRLFLKRPKVELATVRLHAWEPPNKRVRASATEDQRDDLTRRLTAAAEHGKFKPPPMEGTILEVFRGGAWVRVLFGDAESVTPASELAFIEAFSDPRDLQRTLLHAELFGESSPQLDMMRRKFEKMTGRKPEAGQFHQNKDFLARWPTDHDQVQILGPIVPGEHGVLLGRNGFRSHGDAYVQRASGRAWTKAVRVVDRLAAADFSPPPPTRQGEVRLPKFGSIAGWLTLLPDLRARGERATSRFVQALLKDARLLAEAERGELNQLADELRLLRLNSDGDAARSTLTHLITKAHLTRGEIVRGLSGIYYDAEVIEGWIIGWQGPYVVIQPPTQADARSRAQVLRRAGFKRRGGGFAVLVGPRRDTSPVSGPSAVRAEAARVLAREAIRPSDQDLHELGRRFADAETARAISDPRVLGPGEGAPPLRAAKWAQQTALRHLDAKPPPAERTFWQGAADRASEMLVLR